MQIQMWLLCFHIWKHMDEKQPNNWSFCKRKWPPRLIIQTWSPLNYIYNIIIYIVIQILRLLLNKVVKITDGMDGDLIKPSVYYSFLLENGVERSNGQPAARPADQIIIYHSRKTRRQVSQNRSPQYEQHPHYVIGIIVPRCSFNLLISWNVRRSLKGGDMDPWHLWVCVM